MNRVPFGIKEIVEHLQSNKHFSFARYGDGEFAGIFNDYTVNADGVKIDAGLGKQLRAVLRANKPYYHGLLRIGLKYYQDQIEKNYSNINWYNGDMLLTQFINGKGLPLLQELRKKRILYVGSTNCRQLDLFEIEKFIEVPKSSAHKQDRSEEIITAVEEHNIDVIGYSAGPASNIWINKVYEKVEVTQIDFGSLWDGFLGLRSRSYIKNVDFDELRKQYQST